MIWPLLSHSPPHASLLHGSHATSLISKYTCPSGSLRPCSFCLELFPNFRMTHTMHGTTLSRGLSSEDFGYPHSTARTTKWLTFTLSTSLIASQRLHHVFRLALLNESAMRAETVLILFTLVSPVPRKPGQVDSTPELYFKWVSNEWSYMVAFCVWFINPFICSHERSNQR